MQHQGRKCHQDRKCNARQIMKCNISLRAGSLVGTENENRREEWDEEK